MNILIAAASAASMMLAGSALAAPPASQTVPTTLSAQASDPGTMGWMQGFPPPAAKTIRFTDPDYFAFPKLRWTVCHFRELMPTVGVRNGTEKWGLKNGVQKWGQVQFLLNESTWFPTFLTSRETNPRSHTNPE